MISFKFRAATTKNEWMTKRKQCKQISKAQCKCVTKKERIEKCCIQYTIWNMFLLCSLYMIHTSKDYLIQYVYLSKISYGYNNNDPITPNKHPLFRTNSIKNIKYNLIVWQYQYYMYQDFDLNTGTSDTFNYTHRCYIAYDEKKKIIWNILN